MPSSTFLRAMRTRDVIRRIALKVIDQERPGPKYGIVVAINATNSTATIKYVGDTDVTILPYGFIAPTTIGQKVRVEGPRGDRYITDVLPGNVVLFDFVPPPPEPPPPPVQPTTPVVDPNPVDPTPVDPTVPTPPPPASDPDPDDGTLASMAFTNTAASGAALTLDWTAARNRRVKLTANCTLTFSNPYDGGRFQLHLIQDATGGRTVVWPSNIVWAGGSPPVLTATANYRDVVTFIYDVTSDKYFATPTLNFAA